MLIIICSIQDWRRYTNVNILLWYFGYGISIQKVWMKHLLLNEIFYGARFWKCVRPFWDIMHYEVKRSCILFRTADISLLCLKKYWIITSQDSSLYGSLPFSLPVVTLPVLTV